MKVPLSFALTPNRCKALEKKLSLLFGTYCPVVPGLTAIEYVVCVFIATDSSQKSILSRYYSLTNPLNPPFQGEVLK
jgi:hypothetical protein